MMKRPFGAHWLAFLGIVSPGDAKKLEAAAHIASGQGCSLFELACGPVNGLPASEAADALKAGGINFASFCRFFPGNALETYGDPLGEGAARDLALDTFRKDVEYIETLRQKGVSVTFITGPNCYGLGVKYEHLKAEERFDRLVSFAKAQGEIINGKSLKLCVEYLRPEEDFVIGGTEAMIKLLQAVGNPDVLWHADIFHTLERREDPVEALRRAGGLVGYLHAHGTKRNPPGAFYIGDDRAATDRVNWWNIGQMLDRRNYQGPVVPEPFGKDIREAIPVLGEGLPAALEPGDYYERSRIHLIHQGLI